MRGPADVDNDGWRDVIVQNLAEGTTYYADIDNGIFSGFGTVSGCRRHAIAGGGVTAARRS